MCRRQSLKDSGSLGTGAGAGAAGVVVSGLSGGGGGGAIDTMTYCGAGGVCSGAGGRE